MYISKMGIFHKREILFGLLLNFQKILGVYLAHAK